MRHPKSALLIAAAMLAFGPASPAAEPDRPKDGPGPQPPKPALKFDHIRIDPRNRQIALDAAVCLREGQLELLVCKVGTKEYESVLATAAQGAHLHAALLSLGLTPGLPAQWTGSDDQARLLPPRGPELKITFRWKDKAGAAHEAPAGSWLKQMAKKAAVPEKWVFVGSKVLPNGRYWADTDGDIISVSNFEASVIDVPFESSDKWANLEFAANTEAIPPVGTPVEIIIAPLPDAEKSPYARALLEIDRSGLFQVNGRDVTEADLTAWAEKFVARHARAFVVIRADARALVDDVQRAMTALRTGGLRNMDVERLRPEGAILPRNRGQLQQELKVWDEKFKAPQDYIINPSEEAAATLQQIDADLQRLEETRKLLTEYRQALQDRAAQVKPPAP